MIDADNKPLKPNFQINIINIAIKIGLVTMVMLNFNSSPSMSFGYYHFLSLYGTVCFLIACFIEYNRQNYICTVAAFIGLITYQPIYSVLKYDVFDGEVRTYWIIIQSTFIIVTPWIVFDLIRWIVDYKKFKRQSF